MYKFKRCVLNYILKVKYANNRHSIIKKMLRNICFKFGNENLFVI